MLPIVAIIAGAVQWGLTWWPLKYLHGLGLDGIQLSLACYGAGSLALVPALCWQRRAWRGHVGAMLFILLLGGYANVAYTFAMVEGNPIRVMLLFYLAPVWAALGGHVFLDEKIGWAQALGVVLAVAGAFLVLGGFAALAVSPSPVDLLAISSGFAYAMNNIAYRVARAAPVASKNAAMFVGGAFIAAAALPFGAGQSLGEVTANAWIAGALYGLLWLVLGMGITQYGVSHVPASRSAVLLTLELPITAVSAALIMGARMSLMETLGGLFILAATVAEVGQVNSDGSNGPGR